MEYRNLKRVIIEFVNRDGADTALILEQLQLAEARLDISEDGLSADFTLEARDFNNGKGYHFKSLDDWDLVYRAKEPLTVAKGAPGVAEDGQGVKKGGELGLVGKIITGVVVLAILVPFIGILWSWAAGVVRGMGGMW